MTRAARRSQGSPDDLDEGVLADLLGYQIAQAELTTRRLFTEHIGEPMQLKPVEFTILMLLLSNADATGKRLCEALALSAPNLTILLDKLQQRDLIQRVRNETDRRSLYLHLTTAGVEFARRAQHLAATMEDDLKDSLSEAERAMLVEWLRKLARHRHRRDSAAEES